MRAVTICLRGEKRVSQALPSKFTFLLLRLCRNMKMKNNVMPNLFRHLIESNPYKTLKRVQGDKKGFAL